MNRRLICVMLLALAAIVLAACAGEQEAGITIEDAWARPSPMEAGNGAAYMTIRNNGAEDDALIAASADFCEAVEIHETIMGDNDMMSMQPVEKIDIPAGGSATLEPGGLHIMLIGVSEMLEPGQTVTLTLTFEQAGDMVIDLPVREQ